MKFNILCNLIIQGNGFERMLNWVRSVGEGILMALILGLVSKRSPDIETASKRRAVTIGIFMVLEIVSVCLLYSHQENSTLFFAHPFITFFIMNISDYAVYKRGTGDRRAVALEKLGLWTFLVVPVMSGFVLTVGWLIKLYGRYLV